MLVSSSGHQLLEPDGVDAYLELLLPRALVATPNLREAAVLGDTDPDDLRTTAAREGGRMPPRPGAHYVVVKGGHLTESAEDVVVGPDGVHVLPAERVRTGNDHGTGCSLSAAMAALLARGLPVPEAIAGGQDVRGPGPGRRRPVAGSAPGTGPSTISGGPARRRLEAP